MEESKAAMAQQQQLMQQQLMLQHQFQRRQDAMARFPSNIDAHLRPQMPLLGHRPLNPNSSSTLFSANHITPNPNPNTSPNPNPNPNSNPVSSAAGAATTPTTNISSQPQQSPHHKAALQLAYQDAWRVCHPDFKRPFSSLEDACERLLPYHVVADYEAEEDDKILDSATNGQVLSRSQQWDNNIAAKVAEFTATFEKQVLAFNIISRKRNLGEFRTEEKLMMEQLLLQEERQSLLELRAEMDSRQKSSQETHEANMRMAAMVRAESQAHADMMARGPIRGNALGPQGSGLIGPEMVDQDQGYQQEGILNGWGSNSNAHHKDDKEPSDDFLNDDEAENGDAVLQNEWPEGGELDLNAR